jgi:hypothetical protein
MATGKFWDTTTASRAMVERFGIAENRQFIRRIQCIATLGDVDPLPAEQADYLRGLIGDDEMAVYLARLLGR